MKSFYWFTDDGVSEFQHLEREGTGGEFVTSQLGLEEPADAVGALRRAVSTSGVVARNRFTIDDTPMLRDLVD
jgi:hypothetical protein